MHIWLDPSVASADLSLDMNALLGVESILGAMRRGEHFVLGSRSTLVQLQKTSALSLTSKRIVTHVISNLPTLTPLSRALKTRVIVSHTQDPKPSRKSEYEWAVPLAYIGQHGCSKAALVAENLNDANLFEHAARQYSTINRLGGTISLSKIGGGGSTTPNCLKYAVADEKKWALCISDSDRCHPTQQRDTTATKCAAIALSSDVVCSYWDIPSREIENIIPLAFLEEAVPPTHQAAWAKHRSSVYSALPAAHDFADLKLGMPLRKIFSYATATPPRAFWDEIVGAQHAAGLLKSDCLDNASCKAPAHTPCSCVVIQGFGEKILESVVTSMNMRSVHKSCELTAKDPHCSHWFDIGQRVYEWGCALPRLSV